MPYHTAKFKCTGCGNEKRANLQCEKGIAKYCIICGRKTPHVKLKMANGG